MDLWTEGKPDEKEVAVPWEQVWETKKSWRSRALFQEGGSYIISAKIDSEFSTVYWTITLRLIGGDNKLNPRQGFLGPFFDGKIHNILEEDLSRLSEFEAILAKGSER